MSEQEREGQQGRPEEQGGLEQERQGEPGQGQQGQPGQGQQGAPERQGESGREDDESGSLQGG